MVLCKPNNKLILCILTKKMLLIKEFASNENKFKAQQLLMLKVSLQKCFWDHIRTEFI